MWDSLISYGCFKLLFYKCFLKVVITQHNFFVGRWVEGFYRGKFTENFVLFVFRTKQSQLLSTIDQELAKLISMESLQLEDMVSQQYLLMHSTTIIKHWSSYIQDDIQFILSHRSAQRGVGVTFCLEHNQSLWGIF